jgi:hypothetical protein
LQIKQQERQAAIRIVVAAVVLKGGCGGAPTDIAAPEFF